MKKYKFLVLVGIILVTLGAVTIYVNWSAISQAVLSDNELIAIEANPEEISMEQAINQSSLVAKVKIQDIDSTIQTNETEKGIPKTIHNVEIIETYKGSLQARDTIKIMQEGVEGCLVNNRTIFQGGDTMIMILNTAEPKDNYPNTFFISKLFYNDEADKILPYLESLEADL